MRRVVGLLALLFLPLSLLAQQRVAFSQLVLFGDNYSDTLNVYRALSNIVLPPVSCYDPTSCTGTYLQYPGDGFGYETGEFTNAHYTRNAPLYFTRYAGVWHEQLNTLLPGIPLASRLDSGVSIALPSTNYAWGSATTESNSSTIPFVGYNTVVPNMGKQIDNYLNGGNVPDPKALYVVFGGLNDLLADSSPANVSAIAQRVTALVQRLIDAGALHVLVPNVPGISANPSAPINVAAVQFRTELARSIASLRAAYALRGVPNDIVTVDLQTLFTRVFATPAQFGLVNVKDKAQPYGQLADTYLNWDGVNLTTTGHHLIADAACTALTKTRTVLAVSNSVSIPSRVTTIKATVSTSGTYGEQATGTPTGSVTFFYPQTILKVTTNVVIGTVPIDAQGMATISASSIPPGVQTVYATYSGDANFVPGCRSNDQQITVASSDPGYTVQFDPPEAYVGIASPVRAYVQAVGFNGFSGSVTFACGASMPAHFHCSFGRNTSTYTSTVSTPADLIITTGVVTKSSLDPKPQTKGIQLAWLGIGPIVLLLIKRRRALMRNTGLLTVLLIAATAWTSAGCGTRPPDLQSNPGGKSGSGGGGTTYTITDYAQPGSYIVPLTATSNGTTININYAVYIANTIDYR